MHFTLAVFERRVSGTYECTPLGVGEAAPTRLGKNLHKVHAGLVDELRPLVEKGHANVLRRLQLAKGIRLERVRLELVLTGAGERRKVTGLYPVVIEPRWASEDERIHFAYHPMRQKEPFPIRVDVPLDEQLRPLFSKAWASLDDEDLRRLACRGKERLDVLSFSASPRSLLEELPEKERAGDERIGFDTQRHRKKRRALKVLPHLGVNLTQRAARGDLDVGLPRAPHREELRLLLGAGRSQPVLVVGPPGSGKTTLIHHAILDLLEIDGYPAHRNLDRVREAWQIAGRRLIAGMSHLGDWEKRCVEVLEDLDARPVVLVVDDLAHFGRIGQSRDSDRSLADFFRGPLSRRQIVMVGECTPEQLARLEEDAPSFASLFAPIHLPPATPAETLKLMIREVRALEGDHHVEIDPFALRAVLDLAGALQPSRAFPGKAMDPLRELARVHEGEPGVPGVVEPRHVLELFSRKTGVPEILLRAEQPLDPAAIRASFAGQVMGQAEAVEAAVDLVCRIKAGLVDPRRPYGVYLFTGPTGTGKTELAKCLAEYLYGSPARLLRFDMSELADPSAPSRLIGHRYRPEGLLTRPVQEQPFALVLLDEIEKAHPSVHALLLQLFEDGRLTDAAGRTAFYNHTVVVMTSNLGARPKAAVGFGESPDAVMRDIARAVREFFPPELFNRIDRIVPFRPLSEEVARGIAGKELDKLCRRRGLGERGIFVDPGAGVLDRVAAEAFVARDGARSVKRYLEDRISAPLTEAITGGGARAALQILRVHPADDGFSVDRQVLEEAPPAAVGWALEPLLELSLGQLKERLPELLGFVDDLEQRGDLAVLSERIRHHLGQQGEREHAEAVYNLDAMRARLHAFRDRVELFRRTEDEHLREAVERKLEIQRFAWVRVEQERSRPLRYRIFGRQLPEPSPGERKGDVLDALAEGFWLKRALRKVDDPRQHAVFVEVARVARLGQDARFAGEQPGLLEWLVEAYAGAHGEVEDWAADGPLGVTGGLPAHLVDPDPKLGHRYVLKIVGLCALDFFELEAGAHVWTSLARGPEVVRVAVTPARAGETPASLIRRPADSHVPKVVRKIRFDPPAEGAPPLPLELEDYPMAYAETGPARSLAGALAPIWLLRRSREDGS